MAVSFRIVSTNTIPTSAPKTSAIASPNEVCRLTSPCVNSSKAAYAVIAQIPVSDLLRDETPEPANAKTNSPLRRK
jgi:hypothetical protein